MAYRALDFLKSTKVYKKFTHLLEEKYPVATGKYRNIIENYKTKLRGKKENISAGTDFLFNDILRYLLRPKNLAIIGGAGVAVAAVNLLDSDIVYSQTQQDVTKEVDDIVMRGIYHDVRKPTQRASGKKDHESLSKIEKHYYGVEYGGEILYQVNKDIIKDKDLIYPGQMIFVPDKEYIDQFLPVTGADIKKMFSEFGEKINKEFQGIELEIAEAESLQQEIIERDSIIIGLETDMKLAEKDREKKRLEEQLKEEKDDEKKPFGLRLENYLDRINAELNFGTTDGNKFFGTIGFDGLGLEWNIGNGQSSDQRAEVRALREIFSKGPVSLKIGPEGVYYWGDLNYKNGLQRYSPVKLNGEANDDASNAPLQGAVIGGGITYKVSYDRGKYIITSIGSVGKIRGLGNAWDHQATQNKPAWRLELDGDAQFLKWLGVEGSAVFGRDWQPDAGLIGAGVGINIGRGPLKTNIGAVYLTDPWDEGWHIRGTVKREFGNKKRTEDILPGILRINSKQIEE